MTGARFGVIAIFFFLGPPAVGLVTSLIMVAQAPNQEAQSVGWAVIVAIFGMLYAYVLAGLPALLIGIAAAFSSRFVANGWVWVGLCTVVGAAISAACVALSQYHGEGLIGFDPVTLYAAGGAFGAAVCAMLCLAFRPRAAVETPAAPAA